MRVVGCKRNRRRAVIFVHNSIILLVVVCFFIRPLVVSNRVPVLRLILV